MRDYALFKAKILTKSSIEIANASLFEILLCRSGGKTNARIGEFWITIDKRDVKIGEHGILNGSNH
jgi:hypothetical protein